MASPLRIEGGVLLQVDAEAKQRFFRLAETLIRKVIGNDTSMVRYVYSPDPPVYEPMSMVSDYPKPDRPDLMLFAYYKNGVRNWHQMERLAINVKCQEMQLEVRQSEPVALYDNPYVDMIYDEACAFVERPEDVWAIPCRSGLTLPEEYLVISKI